MTTLVFPDYLTKYKDALDVIKDADCDVHLSASDESLIGCHASLLAANSSLLADALSNVVCDPLDIPVIQTELAPEHLQLIAEYLYSGMMTEVSDEAARVLAPALSDLGMTEAASLCQQYVDMSAAEAETVPAPPDKAAVMLEVTHPPPLGPMQKASRAFRTARYMGPKEEAKISLDEQTGELVATMEHKIEPLHEEVVGDVFVNEVNVTTDSGQEEEAGSVTAPKRLRLNDLCEAVEQSLNEARDDMVDLSTQENRVFKCGVCGLSFRTYQAVNDHMAVCKADKGSSGKRIRQFFTDEERKDLLTKGSGLNREARNIYVCALCHKGLCSAWGYRLHMKRHECNSEVPRDTDVYVCTKCNKSFKSSWELQSHSKVHGFKTRNFQCANCNMTFMRRRHLMEHFDSEECSNAFVTEDVARRIAKSEELEMLRHHRCKICDEDFHDRESLASHSKDSHPEAMVCCICAITTTSVRALKEHLAGAHGGARYSCEICGRTFRWRSGRIDHMKKMHGIQSVRGLKPELQAVLPATLEEVERNMITIELPANNLVRRPPVVKKRKVLQHAAGIDEEVVHLDDHVIQVDAEVEEQVEGQVLHLDGQEQVLQVEGQAQEHVIQVSNGVHLDQVGAHSDVIVTTDEVVDEAAVIHVLEDDTQVITEIVPASQ